jgi:hypothetical protein
VSQADQIRSYATEKYVASAREQHEKRFSIRAGDVVRGMKLVGGRTPAVCSALKTKEFLRENALRLIARTGPDSGQSTTVTYTYEFVDEGDLSRPSKSGGSGGFPQSSQEAWGRLRGALKGVFAGLGGGEAYLQKEREQFFSPKDSQ